MPNIIVRKYEGYNRALGKYISSKRQYDHEMKKGGFIPFDEANRIAHKSQEEKRKPYILSQKARDILNLAKSKVGKDGKVRLPERAIKALHNLGKPTFKKELPLNGGWE